jgi:hypothetical protein
MYPCVVPERGVSEETMRETLGPFISTGRCQTPPATMGWPHFHDHISAHELGKAAYFRMNPACAQAP